MQVRGSDWGQAFAPACARQAEAERLSYRSRDGEKILFQDLVAHHYLPSIKDAAPNTGKNTASHLGDGTGVPVRNCSAWHAVHAAPCPAGRAGRGTSGARCTACPTAWTSGPVWVHCASGFRAAIAASLLDATGKDVIVIDDEFTQAEAAGPPMSDTA